MRNRDKVGLNRVDLIEFGMNSCPGKSLREVRDDDVTACVIGRGPPGSVRERLSGGLLSVACARSLDWVSAQLG